MRALGTETVLVGAQVAEVALGVTQTQLGMAEVACLC